VAGEDEEDGGDEGGAEAEDGVGVAVGLEPPDDGGVGAPGEVVGGVEEVGQEAEGGGGEAAAG
jgi:hypothetical protein